MTSGTMTPQAAHEAARIRVAAANLRAAQKPVPMKARPSAMPMRSVSALDVATGRPSTPKAPPEKSEAIEVGGMMPG